MNKLTVDVRGSVKIHLKVNVNFKKQMEEGNA